MSARVLEAKIRNSLGRLRRSVTRASRELTCTLLRVVLVSMVNIPLRSALLASIKADQSSQIPKLSNLQGTPSDLDPNRALPDLPQPGVG
jgi:hypothetical protein